MEKTDRSYIRYVRYGVQAYIFFFLLYAGYRFYLFTGQYESTVQQIPESPAMSVVSRPASVEGFLPIGALMSLKLWITTGVFDRIHPAGLVIFLAALLMAFFLRKGFCGWICPVGALSDLLWKLRRMLFGREYAMNRRIDWALRSVKYILMGFFIYVVFIRMTPEAIAGFIEGDYYKVADVRMLYFFTRMTATTQISLGVLVLLSLVYRNFWCRYLCPYGALLGLIAVFSPLRITRNNAACIHCSRCTRHCPSQLPVESSERILSPECTGCLTCISQCPAKGALEVAPHRRYALHPLLFALLIVSLFFGSLATARLSGKWRSAVTGVEYQRIIPYAASLDH